MKINYIGRIKDQKVVILTGSSKGKSYTSDVAEAVEESSGNIRGQSTYKYKDFGKIKMKGMMVIKYPYRDYWIAYPRPFSYGSGFKTTHIHTEEEIDKLLETLKEHE